MTNNDIVQKLWNLCDVLRDDGLVVIDWVGTHADYDNNVVLGWCDVHDQINQIRS